SCGRTRSNPDDPHAAEARRGTSPRSHRNFGLQLVEPVQHDAHLVDGEPRGKLSYPEEALAVGTCLETVTEVAGEREHRLRMPDLDRRGGSERASQDGAVRIALVDEGVAAGRPAVEAAAADRRLPSAVARRERADVDLVLAALVRRIAEPTSVGRD